MTTDSLTGSAYSLSDFVEVETLHSAAKANKYIRAGYVLINVGHTAMPHYPKGIRDGQFMVLKRPVFIVGRTDDVKHFDLDDGGAA